MSIYVGLIFAMVLPLFTKGDHPFDLKVHLVMFVISCLIMGFLYVLFMVLILKFSAKVPDEKGAILGKRKFIITDEGLVEESESNRNIQKWKSIKSIEENKRSIFVFIDSIVSYVIPKRFFKDEAEQELFINTIKEKIKV